MLNTIWSLYHLGITYGPLTSGISAVTLKKRNLIANVKHLNELCYFSENEELMEKVNSNVLSLIENMTRLLALSNELIKRPKHHVNKRKRKSKQINHWKNKISKAPRKS